MLSGYHDPPSHSQSDIRGTPSLKHSNLKHRVVFRSESSELIEKERNESGHCYCCVGTEKRELLFEQLKNR